MAEKAKGRSYILDNYTDIIEDLTAKEDVTIKDLCKYLCENEKCILLKESRGRILSYQTPMRQCSALLDAMDKKGPKGNDALYRACLYFGFPTSADKLKPDRGPHQLVPSSSSSNSQKVVSPLDAQDLPESWPTREHHDTVKNKKLKVKKVTRDSDPKMLERYDRHLNLKGIYPMYHQRRGHALIIVNEKFPLSNYDERTGSDWDESGLEQLFEGLAFAVTVKRNLDKKGIESAIKEETGADHSADDCFVLFILSHGKHRAVLGSDAKSVSMKSIVDEIYAIEDLKNKPKLIFFQACQGDNQYKGKMYGETSSQPVYEEDERLISNACNQNGEVEEGEPIPMYEDVFVVRSSPDGNRSYRSTERGSWFTQAIIFVFSEFAYKCDFEQLYTRTNDLLSKAETQEEGIKDSADLRHIPGRKLYFFPGLHGCESRT